MSEINAPGGHGHGPLVQKADAARLKQWVTELKSAEQQVGDLTEVVQRLRAQLGELKRLIGQPEAS